MRPLADPLLGLAAATLRVGAEPERVLEVDCGEGEGALFLAREFPRARVRGVDPDERAIRAAGTRIGLDPDGRVAFKVGRRSALPFPGDNFDLVVQREGPLAPAELARVLRPGGTLVLHSTRSPSDLLGLRRRLLLRRLAARGLSQAAEQAIEGGRFLVFRLGERG